MSSALVVLLATGLVALLALVAAIVTVRAARQVARDRAALAELVERAGATETSPRVEPAALVPEPYVPGDDRALVLRQERDPASAPETRIVDGKVFVVPTSTELVATALSRPTTRLTIVVHGLAHALRPESRDRIAALMRRELTRRRRERQRTGRRAARAHVPTPNPGTAWVSPPEADR
ncbi:hypothetical protein [Aeromicrobium sp. Leaf350]|uniref:hypothetical protein n=1 Tax=Aeromicrobium sp. Leaf350 TaxID=2876565 RepID=UPI001E5512F8|nr:hypothetical protein [Aeromicrobium sp. Leaf350]